jgi:hypothetical protein
MRVMPRQWLYHYTSQVGLRGILRSRALWATKIQYLNDAREFSLALDLAKIEIQSRMRRSLPPRTADFLNVLESDLQRVQLVNVHVCSLTERSNQLSQWRGYCRPGDGFSIGFPRDQLLKVARGARWSLVRCIYAKREQSRLVRDWMDHAIRSIRAPIDRHSWQAVRQLVVFAPRIKHTGFAEEREWRLVSPPLDSQNPEYDFRPGKHALIPFLPFHLVDPKLRLPEVEVVVGPTTHPNLSQSSASTLIALHADSYSVTVSDIPFRDW